jgi:hypothetical protein
MRGRMCQTSTVSSGWPICCSYSGSASPAGPWRSWWKEGDVWATLPTCLCIWPCAIRRASTPQVAPLMTVM